MAILKIKSGVAKGAVFALQRGANRIGRAEGNDYRIPDSSISAVHCEVILDGTGKMYVRDLNSSNGTFIQGRRVELGVLIGGEFCGWATSRWFTTNAGGMTRQLPARKFQRLWIRRTTAKRLFSKKAKSKFPSRENNSRAGYG
jgi:S-DNA-T family DNA segregation ATPase FtsK/SpoIIIE